MNEVDIQKVLINRFKTLNSFSNITYLTDSNVAYPNENFTIPDDKRYYELYFKSNAPSPLVDFADEYGLNNYTGFLQINICTPLDVGESEANAKYNWIYKLFSMGLNLDDVTIQYCQRVSQTTDDDHYLTIVRIYWSAEVSA